MFSIKTFLLILLIFPMSVCLAQETYLQTVKTDITLPDEAGKNVLKLFNSEGNVVAVTSAGVFRYKDAKWTGRHQGTGWRTATLDLDGNIWLASAKNIQSEKNTKNVGSPPLAANDTILCLFWENKKTLWVGTNEGLWMWEGRWDFSPFIKSTRVNDIAKDATGSLYIATTKGLWRRKEAKWVNLDETLMAIGNQETYYALSPYNQGKDMIFGSVWAVSCIADNGDHWALRGADGLPYGPVRVVRPTHDGIWMGTHKGAIKKDSSWHYYHGKRWMPHSQVNDILVIDSLTVWMATPEGISQMKQQPMTLAQKADLFENIIALRHNRRGLINRSRLKTPGDVSSSYSDNEDNDGLWTSCYLLAECFRYAATGDSAAKARAIETFEALERLETITGISGYPARSYATATDVVTQSRSPHPKKWHSSPDGKWQWLDDTSSDEITGHLFTLPLFYDMVADSAQKERVRRLIRRIVDHIVDNNYHLIDFDGKPTRWGIWHPDSLNHSPNWMYERGLNSLQILSFLKTAYHFTGDSKFEKHYQYLVKQHGYAQNALQAKIFGPFETSHSDDILNFFPYYNLLRYSQGDPHRELYQKSLLRSWQAVRADHMPVWNVLSSVMLNKDCDLQIALQEIQQYPIDLVNWTMENSHRWDLPKDQLVSRSGKLQSTKPIPTPESNISRWNTNPKHFDAGDDGKTEESGSYFLAAYWIGRYHGFWK